MSRPDALWSVMMDDSAPEEEEICYIYKKMCSLKTDCGCWIMRQGNLLQKCEVSVLQPLSRLGTTKSKYLLCSSKFIWNYTFMLDIRIWPLKFNFWDPSPWLSVASIHIAAVIKMTTHRWIVFSMFNLLPNKQTWKTKTKKKKQEAFREHRYLHVCDLWPWVVTLTLSHLVKTASKSVHPFGWNFVPEPDTQTDTQTNCSENITPLRFSGGIKRKREAYWKRRLIHTCDLELM